MQSQTNDLHPNNKTQSRWGSKLTLDGWLIWAAATWHALSGAACRSWARAVSVCWVYTRPGMLAWVLFLFRQDSCGVTKVQLTGKGFNGVTINPELARFDLGPVYKRKDSAMRSWVMTAWHAKSFSHMSKCDGNFMH